MVCLIKNDPENKKNLKELTKIVGSENAAYYLLCANNGNPLDQTPQGLDSALYSQLMHLYQDPKKAIMAKALVYLPEMGNWVDDPESTDLLLDKQGEPSIKYLASKFKGEISTTWEADDITSLLADAGNLNRTLNILRDNNIINREIPILNAIRSSRNAFVDAYLQEVNKYKEITPVGRYLRSIDAKMIWDERKRSEVIDLIRKRLAKEFGLKEVHVGKGIFFESPDDSVGGKMRVRLVNNLHKFVEGALKDDKGAFVEDVDHELSMLYVSLENGDHTTIVHELAHWYIRRFWETQPVQDALKIMQKRKDKTSIEVEERLVNKLIETLESDEEQSRSFWSAMKKFINKLFSTISNKQEILDDLVAYFAINKDISDLQAETIYIDKIYAPVFQKNATKEEKDILKAIKTAVSSRIEAISHDPMRNNRTLADVRTLDFDLLALDSEDSDDVKKAIKMVLDACRYELSNTVVSIMALAELRGVDNLDIRLFAKLKTDTLGYYVYLVNSKINKMFSAKNPDDDFKISSDLYKNVQSVSQYLNALTTRYDALAERWVDWYIDLSAEELVTFADKEIWKVNAKHWVRNEINNGGLSQFNKLFGAINSDSPIINLVDHLVRRANNYIRPIAEQVGHSLTALYDSYTNHLDILPVNGFRDFCELSYSRDFNGKRGLTGNFRRAENWGEMQAAVNKEKKRVAEQLGIELDDNLRFDWHTITRKLYNKFYDAMDDFYEKNDVVRKYKPDYYRIQRRFQSPETIELKKELQEQIDLIESKCRNLKTGVLETFKLTQEERKKLKDLKKQKKNLGNPYNIELDEQGNIISIELKDPDSPEGIVANEIIAFNDAIKGKIKYIPDWDKYDADLQELKNQGAQPWLLAMWKEDNTIHKIREGILQSGGSRGFEIAQLYAQRSAIIEAAKGRPGHWEPKLWRLSDEAWQELKDIDQAIDELEKEEGYVKPKGRVDPDANVSTIDVFHYEGDVKTDQTEYQYQLSKYYTMSQVDPNAMLEFEQKFHYMSKEKDDYGNDIWIQKPLSVFNMLNVGEWEAAPGLVYEGVVDEPSGKYVKLDKNSQLVERDFDENYSAYIQPRKNGKWHDKGFEELYGDGTTKYAKLYDAMILYMGEIYSNYGMTDTNKYQLPGIRDNISHAIHRKGYLSIGNIKQSLGLNETDTNYNEEKHMRPDGTQIEVLPMRWIRKLDNPNLTSTDLISTISAMYEASLNYKERSSILPIIETLTIPMGGEFNRASDAASVEQREYLRNYIEMYIYDKKRTTKNGNITLNKLADTAMAKTHSKLMAHNWKVVIKNAVDSFWNFTKEVAGGKYFTAKDSVAADGVLAKEILLNIFRNIGIANSRTLTDAILRRNGVGGSISEIFKGQRSSGLRRFLAKHFNMGEYSLIDYAFKGNIALSVYHNHRLIENPLTKLKEFMNKWLAAYVYSKAGLSENDGIKVWSKAGNLFKGETLLDAFTVDKEGNLQIKPKYMDIIRPMKNGRRSNLLETRIETIIRERSSVINGMLDEMDRVAFMRTMVGAMACQMRGWMFSQSADNFKKGSLFMVRNEDLDFFGYTANGVDEKSASFYESEEYRWAIANLSTGFVEAGAQRRLLRSYGRCISALLAINRISKVQKPTKQDKYRFRMINVSLLSMAATIALGVLFGRMVEDDPDDWASNFSYAVNTGAMSERVSQLPAGVAISMMELIRSLFVANALYQDLGSVPDVIVDAGEWWAYEHGYVNNPHFNEEVKRGGYTGTPVWFMHASKASSVLFPNYSWNNIFKNFSNSSNVSSANFYNNQFPISWINYLPDRGTGSDRSNLGTTAADILFPNINVNPFNAD